MRAVLWLLFACVTTGDLPVQDPHTLDGKVYRFCHEPGVDGAEAVKWCALVDAAEPDAVCPGLRETCDGAPWVSSSGCSERGTGGALGGSPSGWRCWCWCCLECWFVSGGWARCPKPSQWC
jgi:hypothetical protein